MNFAQTIKQYRTRNRLTFKQLSKLSGVDPATLNRLEHGHGNPRPMTVYMITQAMKLTPSEIDKKLNPSEPAIVDKPEAIMPDNSMHVDCSADVAWELRTLKGMMNRFENLILVVLTVEIVAMIYIVFFVAK